MYRKSIEKEEIRKLKRGQYEGPVHIITENDRLEAVFSEIHNHTQIGFDTESKPVFVKGVYHHVALMQLATPSEVFLIRLNRTGLAAPIREFLESAHHLKIGLALQNDLQDLQKLEPFQPRSFVDLHTLAKEAGISSLGLRKLSAMFLNIRISKGAQVSNWEAQELTEKQIRYAATDAWACLQIHAQMVASGITNHQ